MSFNRAAYERLFEIALTLYKSRNYRSIAVEMMDMVEEVIGQQARRPDRARSTK